MAENILELNIPPDHRFCTLGGRHRNVVIGVPGGSNARVLVETDAPIESRVLIQKGWKAVAFEGVPADGPTIMRSVNRARQQERESLVAFEVDRDTVRSIGRSVFRAALSRFQLREALGNLSLRELAQLSPEQKLTILRAPRVARLLTDAAAVLEMEVLLNCKDAEVMQMTKDLHKVTKRGPAHNVEALIHDPGVNREKLAEALKQRDGGGNVALHHASDLKTAEVLMNENPETKTVHNLMSQLPVHTFLMRNPEEAAAIELLADGRVEDLLEFDSDGISAAMRTRGKARAWVEGAVSSWDEVKTALESECVSDILPALDRLRPEGQWRGLLGFFFFGEYQVWQSGKHTELSKSRLKVLWDCVLKAFQAAEGRDRDSVGIIRELLRATKGPKPPEDIPGKRFDARGPYREPLLQWAIKLQQLSREVLDKAYEDLQGEDAEWVKSMDNHIAEDIREDPDISSLGLRAEDIKGDGVRFRVPLPSWVREVNMQQIFEDLKVVDMLDEFGDKGAVSSLLQLGTRDHTFSHFTEVDFINVRFFGAWLRGVCNQTQAEVKASILEALGPIVVDGENFKAVDGENFFARKAAKGFPRICEKVVQFLAEFQNSLKNVNQTAKVDESWSTALREIVLRAAAFVNDINGCTLVLDSAKGIRKTIERIFEEDSNRNSKFQLRRIKNAFQRSQRSPVGYTDMKLWVEVEGAKLEGFEGSERMLVELQLLLRDFFEEKHFMHLPYEIFRGSLDWPCHADMLAKRGQSLEVSAEERGKEQEVEEEQAGGLEVEAEGEQEGNGVGSTMSRRLTGRKIISRAPSGRPGERKLEEEKEEIIEDEEDEEERLRREKEEREAQAAKVVVAMQRRGKRHSAKDLMQEGFSAFILWSAGYKPNELKDAGTGCRELKSYGLSFEDLLKLGFSCRSLMREVPCTAEDLRNTIEAMCENGMRCEDLAGVGVGVDDLKLLAFSAERLRELDFDAAALLAESFTVDQLLSGGFSAADLKAAGTTAGVLYKAGFTPKSLCDAGFSTQQLLEAGVSVLEMKQANFSVAQLKAAGATARSLRDAGFQDVMLRLGGFGVKDLANAGCSPGQLKSAGFTGLAIIKEGGFSADELRNGGLPVGRLIKEGFGIRTLMQVGFTIWELVTAGLSVQELTSGGVKLDDVANAVKRRTKEEAIEAGLQPEQYEALARALGLM